jgi:transcriptional regulator of acetoin/glycerol metabolism
MGAPDSLAMPPGADPRQLSRHLGQLHDSFVSSGAVDPALRPVVSESWRRSVRSGVDPERSLARLPLDDSGLAETLDPPLSTMHQPFDRISAEMVDLLIDQIAGTPPKSVTMRAHLVVRGSA